MKLQEYIKKLQQLEKEYGDLPIIYGSSNDGSNDNVDFYNVYFSPTAVNYSKDSKKIRGCSIKQKYTHICIN